LLTHDLDFGGLLAQKGAEKPSVITFRLRDMRPENVNRHLRAIIDHHGDALEAGAIMVATEGWIRLRALPIETRE
jgi:predicted nuclease of predicted toxin-antitoxin system